MINQNQDHIFKKKNALGGLDLAKATLPTNSKSLLIDFGNEWKVMALCKEGKNIFRNLKRYTFEKSAHSCELRSQCIYKTIQGVNIT